MWVRKGEDILHSISDHVLMELTFLVFDGYSWLSLLSSAIKLGRACTLGAYILYLFSSLRICKRNWPLYICPRQFLNSSLYWSPCTIQSLSSLDQVKQSILASGSISEQGSKESSSSLYVLTHNGSYILYPDPSNLSDHLQLTCQIFLPLDLGHLLLIPMDTNILYV